MDHAIEVVRTKNTVEIVKETGIVVQKETGHTTQIISPPDKTLITLLNIPMKFPIDPMCARKYYVFLCLCATGLN